MAAMVGGGTGAAMTAVTMIFEMTRDYDIVMPMILAVALSSACAACCRARTSTRSSWCARGHLIPKALHANMFLVRHANEIMDTGRPGPAGRDRLRRVPAPARTAGAMKHVVVTRDDRIVGVLRVNTALRRGLEEGYTGVTLGDVAQRNFTIAREDDIVFDVIERMWRRGGAWRWSSPARARRPRPTCVGIITKEHVADSVAGSIKAFA